LQGDPAKVYVKNNSGMQPVGESFVREARFRAEGNGTGELEVKLAIPFFELQELLAKDKIQVVTEVNARVVAEIYYLGVGFKITEHSSKVCGFEIQTGSPQKVGLSTCADSVDELVIPNVEETAPSADLISLSPEAYASETRRKNLTFGSLMGVFAALAATCFACGLCIGRHRGQSARELDFYFPDIEKEVAKMNSSQPFSMTEPQQPQ
jgi:hypothetical protein